MFVLVLWSNVLSIPKVTSHYVTRLANSVVPPDRKLAWNLSQPQLRVSFRCPGAKASKELIGHSSQKVGKNSNFEELISLTSIDELDFRWGKNASQNSYAKALKESTMKSGKLVCHALKPSSAIPEQRAN